MTMNEERRYALHERLEAVLGPTEANTLMEHLPPTTWSDLVRQRDLDMMRISVSGDMTILRSDLRGEMAELRTELRSEMAELRTELKHDMAELRADMRRDMEELRTELRSEMAELRAELKHEMAELRAELKHDMAELRAELTQALDRRFSKQMWQFITTTIGLQALTIATIGVMFANMN